MCTRWAASLTLFAATLTAQSSHSGGSGSENSAQRPLLGQYCAGCHNQKMKTGGLAVESLDLAQPAAHLEDWERVLRKLRSGEMPPVGLPRPDRSTILSFTSTLEEKLNRVAVTSPNPGRPAVHRLNRAEYTNAVRDLFALD